VRSPVHIAIQLGAQARQAALKLVSAVTRPFRELAQGKHRTGKPTWAPGAPGSARLRSVGNIYPLSKGHGLPRGDPQALLGVWVGHGKFFCKYVNPMPTDPNKTIFSAGERLLENRHSRTTSKTAAPNAKTSTARASQTIHSAPCLSPFIAQAQVEYGNATKGS